MRRDDNEPSSVAELVRAKAEFGFVATDFAAGIAGGTVPTLILHPLDLIKIRLQVNEGTGIVVSRPVYHGFTDAIFKIARTNGFFSLYQGVLPSILGSSLSWGSYFYFYGRIKLWFQDGRRDQPLPVWKTAIASTTAGIVTLMLTNPLWILKTRMCLQYDGTPRYSSMRAAFQALLAENGYRGLYKGLLPGLFATSHGAIQFGAYEEMKNRYCKYRQTNIDDKLAAFETSIFAAISKIMASCATHPFQVMKARLQEQHRRYNGLKEVISQLLKHEGAVGLYKGLFPALLRIVPANIITFVVYENVSHFLKKGWEKR